MQLKTMHPNVINYLQEEGYECLKDKECGNRLVCIIDKFTSKFMVTISLLTAVLTVAPKPGRAIAPGSGPRPMSSLERKLKSNSRSNSSSQSEAFFEKKVSLQFYPQYQLNLKSSSELVSLYYLTHPRLPINSLITMEAVKSIRGGSGLGTILLFLVSLGILMYAQSFMPSSSAPSVPVPSGPESSFRNPFSPTSIQPPTFQNKRGSSP